ncbi:hypothetical protein Tco_1578421 [Tanacetum coccineum]
MENVNPSSPPKSPNSFRNQTIQEINTLLESLNLTTLPFKRDPSCLEGDIRFVELFKNYEIGDFSEEEKEEEEDIVEEELGVEYLDKFLTRNELAYHKYLLCDPVPLFFIRCPIIVGGNPSNLKIPCNIGHVIKRQLEPRADPESHRGISNFTGRVRGMHIFVGNFNYITDFLIVEDISSVIDPCLSQVVLGKPFVEVSNMTYDQLLGIVKFTNEVAYKMSHKIEQFQSLSNMEKEHKKLVYFRNEEVKRQGVDYVMQKIFGFYKECLELYTKPTMMKVVVQVEKESRKENDFESS